MSTVPRSAHRPVGLSVVIPSVGRRSLQLLLDSLAAQEPVPGWWPPAGGVVVVDDRAEPTPPLHPVVPAVAGWTPEVRTAGGRGPAAARNIGWRAVDTPWVAFLDDDVLVPPGWSAALAADLAACTADDAATQGHITVPLPTERAPTDWERNTAALETARWATADMAYRRAVLVEVGGFDERFPRAYREDADLAVRVRAAGWSLRVGDRRIVHPVRPADGRVSVRVQRGNADDALLRALHGRDWRRVAETGPGRGGWHTATVGAAAVGLTGLLAGRRRLGAAGVLAWVALTADFARRRIAPGPGPTAPGGPAEIARMVVTSAAIPPVALWHRVRGTWQWRRGAPPWRPGETG